MWLFAILLFFILPAADSHAEETVVLCRNDCKVNEDFYALVRLMEGFSPLIYKDAAGHPTVCFGHLIKPGEKFREPMTGEACQKLLEQDVLATQRQVNDMVKARLFVHQHNSLVDFAFNVGAGALQGSTLLKKVNTNQHCQVPPEFLKWVYAGGKALAGLKVRRNLEADMYARQ